MRYSQSHTTPVPVLWSNARASATRSARKRRATLLVEPAGRGVGRAVVGEEQVGEVLGVGEPLAHRRGHRLHVDDLVAEELGHDRLHTPAGRRLRAGRRRDVPADGRRACRRRSPPASSWPARSGHRAGPRGPARGGTGVVGGEHHADGGQDEVERRVAVRQVLGVGLGELDVEVLGRGAATGDLEQLGDVVDAGGHRGAAGGGQGDVAGAGGDVEDPRAGHHADVVDEVLGDRHGDGRDLVVVTAAPDLLLLVAELGVVGT